MSLSATSTDDWTCQQQSRTALAARTADAPATRAEFAASIDRCVHALICATPVPTALTELRRWLRDDAVTLADGTPVDFALFDDAILSIDERIAQTGARSQTQLLHASRQLAESIYAKT